MAEHRCRQRRPILAVAAFPVAVARPMEAVDEPMNHYISARPSTGGDLCGCADLCLARQNRALLEQLTELSAGQSQLLMDLLGAVNALTAAILTARVQL